MDYKVAFVSHVLPPSPSGQAVMLFRILSGVNKKAYYMIHTGETQAQDGNVADGQSKLECQYYYQPPKPVLNELRIIRLPFLTGFLKIFARTYLKAKNIASILQQEPATTEIVACTGDLTDIPAAFIASRKARIPFFAYIFDDYVFQWIGSYRLFAKLFTPFIFKHSAGIIGPNEFICEEYRQRYGVEAILVRNPCDLNELHKEPFVHWPAERSAIKILYTGAVYHANYDCFHNLLRAMNLLSDLQLELHIFTAQMREELLEQNIKGDNVIIHSHVPYKEILEQQHKADILFLPLAFESPIPDVIRTSAPAKMGEYLASGRPVLAHVPADSFVSYYF